MLNVTHNMEMDLFLAPKLPGALVRKTVTHIQVPYSTEQGCCHPIKWLGSWNDALAGSPLPESYIS